MIVEFRGKRFKLHIPYWLKYSFGILVGIGIIYILFGIYAIRSGHPIW